MKVLILVTVVGLVSAAPHPQEEELPPPEELPPQVAPVRADRPSLNSVPILHDSRDGPDGDGNFNFRYETGDGIVHEAQGTNSGDGIVRVSGSYSYLSPEGEAIDISYTADENGFQAFGAAVPTAPPMPPHALAQLKAAQEAFAKQDFRVEVEQEVAPVLALEEQVLSSPVDRQSGARPG